MKISVIKVFIALTMSYQALASTLYFMDPKDKGSLSNSYLKTLAQYTQASSFIETGTLTGNTTMRAAAFYKQVYTIEFSKYFFNLNVSTFKNFKNINAFLGDSSEVLPKIMHSIKNDRCIFFLDAHYSGGNTAQGKTNTPLLEEIRTIGTHIPSSIVIIDDLRLCQEESLVQKQLVINPNDTTVSDYPTISQLKELFHAINPHYKFIIWGDTGFAIPLDTFSNITFSPVLLGMTKSRFFDHAQNKTAKKTIAVLKAEQSILHATQQEKSAFFSLLDPAGGLFRPEIFTAHYRLWNALVHLSESNYQRAHTLIEECLALGLTHWRMQWYLAYIHKMLGNTALEQEYISHIENELLQIGLSAQNPFDGYFSSSK